MFDEIGCLKVTSNGTNLFFVLVDVRYNSNLTVPTSSKSYKEWWDIFSDSMVASALPTVFSTTATTSTSKTIPTSSDSIMVYRYPKTPGPPTAALGVT